MHLNGFGGDVGAYGACDDDGDDRLDDGHAGHHRRIQVLIRLPTHPSSRVMLLFQLLRALCGRFIADFQFLKDFLEKEVCEKYTVEWKRAAFFEFVKLWKSPTVDQQQSGDNVSSSKTIPQELKGKIDSTEALAKTLTDFKAQLFVTSGHATERGWQIGFTYKNGYFKSYNDQRFTNNKRKNRKTTI